MSYWSLAPLSSLGVNYHAFHSIACFSLTCRRPTTFAQSKSNHSGHWFLLKSMAAVVTLRDAIRYALKREMGIQEGPGGKKEGHGERGTEGGRRELLNKEGRQK